MTTEPSTTTTTTTASTTATLTADRADADRPTISPDPVHQPESHEAPWWRHAVIYQIYPRSFADGDGDGIGDLPGITSRLPYLAELGVDAVWLSPFYTSPQADAGYDVADYRDVDPLFGSLSDADALIARAHDLGIKVIVDVVPNHSSDEHEWFQQALAAAPGSPERERYMFREGKGENGELPPNNWLSVFGKGAWTRVTEADGRPGQWYLHLFDTKQPDFNWRNPVVRKEFHDILRFWLDRGVDGFRVDVAHGLVKKEGLPDAAVRTVMLGNDDLDAAQGTGGGAGAAPPEEPTHHTPYWDQDEVHEIYRGWREVLDSYGSPDRILCAEAWVNPVERAVRYVRKDEMHQQFNFAFLVSAWRGPDLRACIEHSLAAADSVGAPSTWVLSNHDVVRHASRLGYPVGTPRPLGIHPRDPQPDAELGLKRARAATMLMLALPGSSYIYQGEELGLPESSEVPDELREDPAFHRTEGQETGRDGCRIPMPWVADAPGHGFGPSGRTWLPQPSAYGLLAADQQDGVDGSTLELYRSLLRTRRDLDLGVGALTRVEGYPSSVVAYANLHSDRSPMLVLLNCGDAAVELPDGATVLAASGPLEAGRVPTDTAVWARWE